MPRNCSAAARLGPSRSTDRLLVHGAKQSRGWHRADDRLPMDRLLRALVATLLLLLGGTFASAQTGSVDPTRAQLAALPTFTPAQIELIEEPVVDLRPWLPPVGEQRRNDCTCWAIGYAAKSYLEARDQGWLPDRPERTFSPTFLYNQINGGRDEGSSFVEAIRLMTRTGAATLATAPYDPDVRKRPDARAQAEAAAFPLLDAQLLADRTAIRRALQRRQVVVFGAHVNPVFLSGRFTKYTRELFVRDQTLRQPGQPHGKHAMCIVGYDDRDGVFLVQNSWGTAWCQRGYARIAYELFDEIRLADASEGLFCNWAVTLVDVEEKVERGADGSVRPVAAGTEALAVRGHLDAVSFDADKQGFVYTFVADLRGPRAVLDTVRSVTWSWLDAAGKPRRAVVSTRENAFALVGATDHNPLELVATVDSTAKRDPMEVIGTLTGPVPRAEFRTASLVFQDQYGGRTDDGAPSWYAKCGLEVPLGDQAQIREVRWDLGGINRLQPKQVKRPDNGPAETQQAGGLTRAPNEVTCEIVYTDGGVKTLRGTPTFTDVVRDEAAIEASWRELPPGPDGRPTYAWTLRVDLPWVRQWTFDVDHVDWELDPWLVQPRRTENQVSHDWAISGTSDRDFRATAVLHKKDGSTERLERWIELGPSARYDDADRLALRAHDVYIGRVDGQPRWRSVFQLVGDRQQLAKVQDVVFVGQHAGAPARWPMAATRPEVGYAWSTDGSGPATAVMDFRLAGVARSLRSVHTPRAPIDDRLLVTARLPEQADTTVELPGATSFVGWSLQLGLHGPADELLGIRHVEWQHRVRGRAERTSRPTIWLDWPQLCELSTIATGAQRIEAAVTFHDGYREHVDTFVTPGGPLPQKPALALRVRERHAGLHPDWQTPRWHTIVELVGSGEALAELTSAELRELDPWGHDAADRRHAFGPDRRLELLVDGPRHLVCNLERSDGSKLHVTGTVYAEAPERDEFTVDVALRPQPDGSPKNRVHWLQGPLGAVTAVQWLAADGAVLQRTTTTRIGLVTGFPLVQAVTAAAPTRAVLELADGGRREIAVPTTPVAGFVTFAATSRHHGDDRYEVDLELVGDPAALAHFGHYAGFELRGRTDDPAWPRLTAFSRRGRRLLLPAGEHEILRIATTRDGERHQLPGGHFVVGGERHTALALRCTEDPRPANAVGAPLRRYQLVGPERLLLQVRSVGYRVGFAGERRITRRFGGSSDGFLLRLTDEPKAQPVRAIVELSGNQRLELTWQP